MRILTNDPPRSVNGSRSECMKLTFKRSSREGGEGRGRREGTRMFFVILAAPCTSHSIFDSSTLAIKSDGVTRVGKKKNIHFSVRGVYARTPPAGSNTNGARPFHRRDDFDGGVNESSARYLGLFQKYHRGRGLSRKYRCRRCARRRGVSPRVSFRKSM